MELGDIRREIDAIDDQLVALLCRRLDCATKVAAYKRAHGLPVLHPQREQEVLARVRAKADPAYREAVTLLFSSFMDISRGIQHRQLAGGAALRELLCHARRDALPAEATTRVVCQGRPGAYSGKAAGRLFPAAKPAFVHSFEEVFAAVKTGKADFGILPVENSSTGSVNEVYDLLMSTSFFIAAAVDLPVHHNLLGLPGTPLSAIREVYSHPQALSQCGEFLAAYGLTPHPFANTAMAAEMVADKGEPSLGAIGSREAAAAYGLDVLQSDIQTKQNNSTRFLAISSTLYLPENADKISLMFSLPHQTGSLYRILARFAVEGLNLTKIESRPLRSGGFDYLFYLDFEGKLRHTDTVELLCALSDELPFFQFLGNYRELASCPEREASRHGNRADP